MRRLDRIRSRKRGRKRGVLCCEGLQPVCWTGYQGSVSELEQIIDRHRRTLVRAFVAAQRIVSSSAIQSVVSQLAHDIVIAGATFEEVLSKAAVDGVVAKVAADPVPA